MMKRIIFIVVFFAFYSTTYAQFGISGSYVLNNAEEWTFTDNTTQTSFDLLPDNTQFSVNYWFRLKNKRLEFLPELAYHATNQTIGEATTKATFLSFNFNTQIYPFDFANDCDCPTFSKQSDFFSKSFFLNISPGVSYFKHQYQLGERNDDNANITYSVGIGTGLDIGVSDFVTITPFFTARYFPEVVWTDLEKQPRNFDDNQYDNSEQMDSPLWQMTPGIRILFRPDYTRGRRW